MSAVISPNSERTCFQTASAVSGVNSPGETGIIGSSGWTFSRSCSFFRFSRSSSSLRGSLNGAFGPLLCPAGEVAAGIASKLSDQVGQFIQVVQIADADQRDFQQCARLSALSHAGQCLIQNLQDRQYRFQTKLLPQLGQRRLVAGVGVAEQLPDHIRLSPPSCRERNRAVARPIAHNRLPRQPHSRWPLMPKPRRDPPTY